MTRNHQSGLSLIELMVAMTIGIGLIGGAVFVYQEARATLAVNDTLARLQENARFALDAVIEPDVRMAGYWGRHTDAFTIEGRASGGAPLNAAVGNDCGPNWAIDVDTSLESSNNAAPGWACLGGRGTYQAGTDALAVRHASGAIIPTAALEGGRIYLRSHEAARGALFAGANEPPINDGQNHMLVANAYYVRPFTFPGDGLPSLRRQELTMINGNAVMVDREVMPGVEDMQVQFGIDSNGDGSVDRYVNADNGALAGARTLAVRIWLLMRAQTQELGFRDEREYVYADKRVRPDRAAAPFRRLLVSRTVFLRNEAIVENAL